MTVLQPTRSGVHDGRPSTAKRRLKNAAVGSGRPSRGGLPGRRTVEFAALMLLTLGLTLGGLAILWSASVVAGVEQVGTPWYFVQRQGLWALVGLVLMTLVMRVDYHESAKLARPLLILTLALLILVLIPSIGTRVNGARRWLVVGPLTIQPSELAKLAITLFAARLLAARAHLGEDGRLTLLPVLSVAIALAALIILEPSQGSATMVVAVALILLFAAGVSLWSLGLCSLGLGGIFAALAVASPYRRARLAAWADPLEYADSSGYQSIQALIGIASGGVDGVGIGSGRAKWGFLPFVQSDFIFTVVAEELGFIGAGALILLFLLLLAFGIRVARKAPDRLGSLLAVGVIAGIVLQAFINVGAVVGALPISGVTLPFISLGGSSLIVNLVAMGIVLNVARQVT